MKNRNFCLFFARNMTYVLSMAGPKQSMACFFSHHSICCCHQVTPAAVPRGAKGDGAYMMEAPKFRIKHVGITTGSEQEARALEKKLCALFGLEDGHENDAHIFAGDLFEIMKHDRRGKKGHVGLYTEDIDRAVEYFAEKGIGLVEETVKRDENGHITFAYLDVEFEGFAFHLTY